MICLASIVSCSFAVHIVRSASAYEQMAEELSQKVNVARDMLKENLENPDGWGTCPVDVDDSNSND